MDNLDPALPPQKTLSSRAITAGLYIAGAINLIALIVYVCGFNETLMTNKPLSWLNNLLSVGITFYFIHMAIRMFRDQDNGGYLSVGQGMGLGTLAGLVSGIVTAVWIVVFMTFIAPDLAEVIKRITLQQMVEAGQSEDQAEQTMDKIAFMFSPVTVAVFAALAGVFIGFLSGLVSGLLQKKDRPYA
ncbi:MAG: DUF4199 domain-containing protein [Saprospiraceae bacterium]